MLKIITQVMLSVSIKSFTRVESNTTKNRNYDRLEIPRLRCAVRLATDLTWRGRGK